MTGYEKIFDVIVIGAGPAGLMAAITASREGASVLVLEKKEEAGRKLLLTGHGRCNITNLLIPDNFRETFHENARFLTSAFSLFSPEDTRTFFSEIGVPTHEEEDGRVFPDAQKARVVRDALVKELATCGAELLTEAPVTSVRKKNSENVWEVETTKGAFGASALILATGGATFPDTGSEGDGYKFAKMMKHTVTPLAPALAPILLSTCTENTADRGEDCGAEFSLAGITLPDVSVMLLVEGKKAAEARGELLFTHQGVSGPSAMKLTRKLPEDPELYKTGAVTLRLDFLPDMRREQAEELLLAAMQASPNRHMKRLLCETFHLMEKISTMVLPEDLVANAVTKEVRRKILSNLKESVMTVEKRTPMAVAYVTCGGVNVKEIAPKTMMSKVVPGLFFCGEVMDVDGASGGYNLQCAWSTGFAAGKAAAVFSREEAR